jgi:hypothetical protein
MDKAGNLQTTENAYMVKVDTGIPEGNITSLTAGNYYKEIPSISGTALDDLSDIEASGVKLQIKRANDPINYWNGTGWQPDLILVDSVYNDISDSWVYNNGPASANVATGDTYEIKAHIYDKAGNEKQTAFITCYGDSSFPTAAITSMQDGNDYNASTIMDIDGTADDNGIITSVELIVKYETSYWDSDSWEATPTWLVATTTNSYENWHSTGISYVDGLDHLVWFRVTDNAGNVTVYNTQNASEIDLDLNKYMTFTYDETDPVSDLTFPVDKGTYNVKFGTFSGTGSDPAPGSDINFVKVKIKRTDGKYWHGSYWGTDIALTVTPPYNNWEYYIDPAQYNNFYENNEDAFYLYPYAVDNAGNFEALTGKCGKTNIFYKLSA